MKAIVKTSKYARLAGSRMILSLIAVFGLMTFISSCERGHPGRPGTAYLALEWEVDKPDLIDAGTPDIPPVFQWGTFYRAYPGWYLLYYEGEVWTGQANAFYAWEIEYEIWEDQGEPGGHYYNGDDGYDTYFTLVCSPHGPFVDEYLSKAAPGNLDFKVLSQSADTIEILKEGEGYSMKAVYRRVEQGKRKTAAK